MRLAILLLALTVTIACSVGRPMPEYYDEELETSQDATSEQNDDQTQ